MLPSTLPVTLVSAEKVLPLDHSIHDDADDADSDGHKSVLSSRGSAAPSSPVSLMLSVDTANALSTAELMDRIRGEPFPCAPVVVDVAEDPNKIGDNEDRKKIGDNEDP